MHDHQQRVTSAIILAGGLGTRLRSAVPDVPKPMAPIEGRPFMEHQLDYWISQGIERFVLSVGYRREIIMAHFGANYRGRTVEYAAEETPQGTGGGFFLAVEKLLPHAPFLVLNGDTFFNVPLDGLSEAHGKHRSEWTVALFRANEPNRYGKVLCGRDGRVEKFASEKASVGELANGGVYLVSPEALSKLPRGKALFSLEQDCLSGFISAGGRCYGMPVEGSFFDIGTPPDYHHTVEFFRGLSRG